MTLSTYIAKATKNFTDKRIVKKTENLLTQLHHFQPKTTQNNHNSKTRIAILRDFSIKNTQCGTRTVLLIIL